MSGGWGGGGGVITGETGDATQVAFFDGTTTLSGDSEFTFTAASKTLTLGGPLTGSAALPLAVVGGPDAGDDLTLRATSHATDGDIIFQTDPTTEIGRFTSTGLGIGTTPAATFWLHVKNLSSGNTPVLIEGNGAGNGGYVSFRDGDGSTVSGNIGHSGPLLGSGTGFAASYAAGDFRFAPIGEQGVLIQPTTAGSAFLSVAGSGAGYGGYIGVYGAPGVRVGLVGHEGPITGSGSRLAFQGDAGALVRGGTSASNGLELSSTSHATKGVITSDSVFRGPDGTSSAPTYSFTNDTDTGMSQTGPGILDFYVGGDIKMRMQSGQIAIGDDATLVSGVTLAIKHSPSSTSTVQENLRITRATTGVGAVGLGSRFSVFLEDGSNNEKESWDQDIVVTTATAASMTVRADYYLRIANVLEATYQVTATTEAGGVWDVKPQTANEGNLGTNDLPFNSSNVGTTGFSVWNAAADANPLADLTSNGLRFGAGGASAVDTTLSRGAANRLDVGSGDTFQINTDRGVLFEGTQTNAAGASVGTLTNAPAAGDPTFWLKIIINGVNRAIPCWAG